MCDVDLNYSHSSSYTVVAHLNRNNALLSTVHIFKCGTCIMGMFSVILKLGFRRVFDGTVNGNAENSKCIELTMYLLSFIMEIKKCVHEVQVAMYNSIFLTIMEYDLTHIFTGNLDRFQWSPNKTS